jgi:hypothetical protein
MPTRIAYQRELSRRLYESELPVVAGTNTSSTGTTITDTTGNLNYSSGDVNFYDGVYVYVVTSAEAARGESRVTRGGYTVTGSLTVDPSITSLASGDLFVLSKHTPTLLKNALNRLLRNTYTETFFPLSLHIVANDNNDMESSGLDGDYSKTNAAIAAETTIVHNGAQSMKVTDDGSGGGYANIGSIGIPENKQLYAAVMCYVTSGDSATFRVIDVTGSNATIKDATTDEPSWTELIYQFTTPADSEQIDFRFIADSASDVIYCEDFQVWYSGSGVYPVPSWLEWPEQIIDVRGFPQGTTGPSSDNDYRADERASVHLNWHPERVDRRAGVPFRIWVESTSMRPYIYAYRPQAELTADDGTSNADLDALVEDASFIVLHSERAEQYLSVLRQQRLGGAAIVAPRRVGVR